MVLHAIGMCPICTYRTGRRERNLPSSLYRLHDTVSTYATACTRLRNLTHCPTSVFSTNITPSPFSTTSTPLPLPFATSASGTAMPITSFSFVEPDAVSGLRAEKERAEERLLAALQAFAAEFVRVDLQEVSPALFSVLLELTQALELEGLLVLGWVDGLKKKKAEREIGVVGGVVSLGEKEDVSGSGDDEVPAVEFKKHMATRIEAVKMAMIAPKGWYLEEIVEKFERQGREIVRRMLRAAIRGLEKGERVVLGADGREFWLGGDLVEGSGDEETGGGETAEEAGVDENRRAAA